MWSVLCSTGSEFMPHHQLIGKVTTPRGADESVHRIGFYILTQGNIHVVAYMKMTESHF